MNKVFISSTSASLYEIPIVSQSKGIRKVTIKPYSINFPIAFNDDFEEKNFRKAIEKHISAGVFVIASKDEGARLKKELEKKEELNLDADNKSRSKFEKEVDNTIKGALNEAGVDGGIKTIVKKGGTITTDGN